jgi:hypothetical protein
MSAEQYSLREENISGTTSSCPFIIANSFSSYFLAAIDTKEDRILDLSLFKSL